MPARDNRIKPKQSTAALMFKTHDPLGELQRAEQAQENDYFRKLNRALLVALRAKSDAEIEQAIQQYTHMRCPKCGEPLEDTPEGDARMALCPRCGGIWLEKGAWEGRVGPKAQSWLQQFFDGLITSKHARL